MTRTKETVFTAILDNIDLTPKAGKLFYQGLNSVDEQLENNVTWLAYLEQQNVLLANDERIHARTLRKILKDFRDDETNYIKYYPYGSAAECAKHLAQGLEPMTPDTDRRYAAGIAAVTAVNATPTTTGFDFSWLPKFNFNVPQVSSEAFLAASTRL